jgi:nicotinamide riboside transporter PnuC
MSLPLPFFVFFFANLAPSLASIVSLVHLFRKHLSYWHWRNASVILGFFAFYLNIPSSPLAFRESPLWQAQLWNFIERGVLVLIVGMYGFYVWKLELRQGRGEIELNEPRKNAVTWMIFLGVFTFNLVFLYLKSDGAIWTNVLILSLSLIADFAIIRKFLWSWLVLILINVFIVVSSVDLYLSLHIEITWQFLLSNFFRLVLAGMNVYGWFVWQKQEIRAKADLPSSSSVTQNHLVLTGLRYLLLTIAGIGLIATMLFSTKSQGYTLVAILSLAATNLCLSIALLTQPRVFKWALFWFGSSVVLVVIFVLVLGTIKWSLF